MEEIMGGMEVGLEEVILPEVTPVVAVVMGAKAGVGIEVCG